MVFPNLAFFSFFTTCRKQWPQCWKWRLEGIHKTKSVQPRSEWWAVVPPWPCCSRETWSLFYRKHKDWNAWRSWVWSSVIAAENSDLTVNLTELWHYLFDLLLDIEYLRTFAWKFWTKKSKLWEMSIKGCLYDYKRVNPWGMRWWCMFVFMSSCCLNLKTKAKVHFLLFFKFIFICPP